MYMLLHAHVRSSSELAALCTPAIWTEAFPVLYGAAQVVTWYIPSARIIRNSDHVSLWKHNITHLTAYFDMGCAETSCECL